MSCKYLTTKCCGDTEAHHCSLDDLPCGHPHDDACLKQEWFEEMSKGETNEERNDYAVA